MEESEKNTKPPFSTRDLYLASTLVTLHFPLLGIDMQYEGIKPKPIGYFKFPETPDLQRTRGEYNQGLILVEPRLFIANLQALKAEVMNFAFNPNSDHNKAALAS